MQFTCATIALKPEQVSALKEFDLSSTMLPPC